MGMEQHFFAAMHASTKRDYLARMIDDKVHCMEIARKYDKDFFDGERRYGFGGYKYDGRWLGMAKKMVKHYNLPSTANILEVGCGKGYLLYEFTQVLPQCTVVGFDISEYAIENGKEEIRHNMFVHNAKQTPYPFQDKAFDLVFSIATLHNLPVYDLANALPELSRIAKQSYLCLESYRNAEEQFNVQCWALTCESFFNKDEWIWLYNHFGYTGDYEFMYFQ